MKYKAFFTKGQQFLKESLYDKKFTMWPFPHRTQGASILLARLGHFIPLPIF